MIAVAKADPPHRIDHLTFSVAAYWEVGSPHYSYSISGEKERKRKPACKAHASRSADPCYRDAKKVTRRRLEGCQKPARRSMEGKSGDARSSSTPLMNDDQLAEPCGHDESDHHRPSWMIRSISEARMGNTPYTNLQALDCPLRALINHFPRLRKACFDSSKPHSQRGISCASTAKPAFAPGTFFLSLFSALSARYLSASKTLRRRTVRLVYHFFKRCRHIFTNAPSITYTTFPLSHALGVLQPDAPYAL